MKLKNETQNKTTVITKSILAGAISAVLLLVLGLVLDYAATQILSQWFIRDCSEDCYFDMFNAFFVGVAALSIAGGIWVAVRTYKKTSAN